MSAAVRWSRWHLRRGATRARLVFIAALALAAGAYAEVSGAIPVDTDPLPAIVQVRWVDTSVRAITVTSGSIVSSCGHVLTALYDAGSYRDAPLTIEIWGQPDPYEAMRHLYNAELYRVDLALELVVLRIVTTAEGEPLPDACALPHLTIVGAGHRVARSGDPLTLVGYPAGGGPGVMTLRRWLGGFAGEFDRTTIGAVNEIPAGNAWITYEEPWGAERLIGMGGGAILDERGFLIAIPHMIIDGLGMARLSGAIELLRGLRGATIVIDMPAP